MSTINPAALAAAQEYYTYYNDRTEDSESRDFAVWFCCHWPNGNVESARQAWLSALGTIR